MPDFGTFCRGRDFLGEERMVGWGLLAQMTKLRQTQGCLKQRCNSSKLKPLQIIGKIFTD